MGTGVSNRPAKVRIVVREGAYGLWVDDRPFYVKGAGLEFGSPEKLAAHGGNSFRTWRTDNGRDSAKAVLDRAWTNGLYVTMGLDLGCERHGFDYNDSAAVARQFESVKRQVLEFKDHPALLIWCIGNELNLNAQNPKVWDAVNAISKEIHEIDTNHLTMTAVAGASKDVVSQIKARASNLDVLGFQMYADLVNLPRYLREADWTGPYIVSEWGATGHWEVPKTRWGAPIENDSTTKADCYRRRYDDVIRADTRQCLGSYVFLWEQKQERTPTWYGMFLETGEETASVDVMHGIWKGAAPDNSSPRVIGTWLDGRTASDNTRLIAGHRYKARTDTQDPNNDSLTYCWEIMRESTDLKTGGDAESKPERVPGLIVDAMKSEIELTAPEEPGAYRLFMYAYDGRGHAAHANIPFLVERDLATARAVGAQ